jgi:hypothetical protein
MNPSHPTDPDPQASRRRRGFSAAVLALALTGLLSLLGSATALAAPTAPPPVSILTSTPGFGHGQDLFLTPTGDTSTYANGPEIVDTAGNVVWFHATPPGLAATGFRTQRLWGQNVLTFWQGTENGGQGSGTDYIYNDHYQQIATVNAGNGLQADAHEFYITPWGTALITAYQPATADLSSIGGPSDQKVVNGVVQEIDIKTGQVLWQWNSAEHVPYSASEQPVPASASQTWDWFHVNSIHLDGHGGFLVDARNTWAAYDVARSGNVEWTLGGKDSTFAEQAAPGQTLDNVGEIFTWQHDPEALGGGYYSFFDDESTIGARLRLQPLGPPAHRPPQHSGDARRLRQPASRRPGELPGERPAALGRGGRIPRRVGKSALPVGLRRARQAHVRRLLPRGRELLQGLPGALEPGPLRGARRCAPRPQWAPRGRAGPPLRQGLSARTATRGARLHRPRASPEG